MIVVCLRLIAFIAPSVSAMKMEQGIQLLGLQPLNIIVGARAMGFVMTVKIFLNVIMMEVGAFRHIDMIRINYLTNRC